ncbi:MAG: phage holin family protein [Alphaproteobacteria bacterium]
MARIPYQENPELMAMKEDIAERKYRVQMTGLLVGGALIAAAIASVFFFPAAAGAIMNSGAGGAKLLITGLLGVGAAITTMLTLKEVKRLEVDEKYVQSYMQGKNYWGEGYRKEVAEHGYGGVQTPQTPNRFPLRENEQTR